ncbi:MAG: rhodanese-like domain-containing protein [Planctomycetota bacterium]|jgi:sodium/bile acid cotransporter 7
MFGKKTAETDQEKRAKIDAIYMRARSAFPGVPEISAKQVLERRAAGEPLLLVDVRTPEEQAVSMIPGAVTVEQLESDPGAAEGKTIVCYCTIGGRSGRYTQELCRRGVEAMNMPGAVLAWSHEGGEFEGPDGPTKRVHTHGPKFDLLAEGYDAVY